MAKAKVTGRTKRSTTGKGKASKVKADQSNWRTKLQQARIKFDDDQKTIFLKEFASSGLKGRAAQMANTTYTTVDKHRENDPDFAEAYDEAERTFNNMIVDTVTKRAVHGVARPVFNKGMRAVDQLTDVEGRLGWRNEADGDDMLLLPPGAIVPDGYEPILVPATIREFSDRMLELHAKRSEPGFRDKQTIDLNNTGGGVLLAPAGVTPEQAVAEGNKANEEARKKREEAAKK